MEFDNTDLQNLATMIWKEARGQGSIGMQAVGCVAVNRVGFTGFPDTLHDVIYGKNQFTSMSVPTDPQFNTEPDGDSWEEAKDIAAGILAGTIQDPTLGAHYYANLATATSTWFYEHIVANSTEHPHTVNIGAHSFYV